MVFKLVKKLPKMRLAVDALIGGLTSIGYIGVMMFLTFYFFAIFAIILFKYARCLSKEYFPSSQFYFSYRQNDPWHFGNIHLGMITLFRMSTLEDWTDIM
jgi:voltage-gated sodium channel